MKPKDTAAFELTEGNRLNRQGKIATARNGLLTGYWEHNRSISVELRA